ncbi:ABC transporter substrate-binding protein [Pelotomaculum propionicicum]|uniref:ABC transporter substrate-binding protein n=1 Tax=Pelotomaculum propionicicum TaxID=258475 RepID=UPI001FA99DA1|nr:ABC transporter substrate-binding protein [Pelotomaculum propionicicum]
MPQVKISCHSCLNCSLRGILAIDTVLLWIGLVLFTPLPFSKVGCIPFYRKYSTWPVALLGPVSSDEREAVLKVCTAFKTPLLYGISYEGGSYNHYLFCYSPVPDHMIKPLVPYMNQNFGNSFYILGYDYLWPHKMSEAIKQTVGNTGGTVVGTEFTPFGVKDYSEIIKRIEQSGAKNLMLIMPGPDGYNFIKQFNREGLKNKVQIAAIAADEAYLEALPPQELEGIITPVHFISSVDKPETLAFVKKHQQMYGEDSIITYSTESHYGLMMMLAEAIKKTGSLDKEKIISSLEGLELTIGNGKVQMRDDHHMNLNMLIAGFHNGQLVMAEDIGNIVPEDQRKRAEY